MNKTSPVFMHLFLTNPPVHPRETNRTREGECWGRWRGHSPWAALPPGCRCARSNPLADFFPFQPAQTRRSYFCAKVATKQSSPRANAGGLVCWGSEPAFVFSQNLSGLPTGAARGHPDVAGGCFPVKSDAAGEHFLNLHLHTGLC